MAAWNGGAPSSSMWRKMFSSTTIASSMTMPTASVSASSVMLLSVNPAARISAKLAMIDAGIASEATSTTRKFRMNAMITRLASRLPQHQVLLERRDRRVDELRVVAGHRDLHFRRQRAAQLRELGADRLDDLTVFWPDWRRTSITTVRSPSKNADVRASSVVSSTAATSRIRIGVPARSRRRCRRTAPVIRVGRASAASARRPPARCGRRGSPRSLRPTASRTRIHRQPVRVQLFDVEDDVDLASWPPEIVTSPTPSTVSIAATNLLVGDLRQRADPERVPRARS